MKTLRFKIKKQSTTNNIVGNKISVSLSQLSADTRYFCRTFVALSNLTYYGETLTFTTKDFTNIISSCEAYDITENSAIIRYSGDASVIEEKESIVAGIAFSSSMEDLFNKKNLIDCPLNKIIKDNPVEIAILDLEKKTTYYYCAITIAGDKYKNGEVKSFTTSDIPEVNPEQGPNLNRNTTGPIEAQTRYEFPLLKGGKSVVVVHKANINSGDVGVNYSVEWDTDIHAQRWSCWQMYAAVNAKSTSRYSASNDGSLSPSCQYPNDTDLEAAYRLTADPYKYNGFDHGHICPSADRLCSYEANYQTFFITNMQPQYSNFNGSNSNSAINQRSPWYRLEDKIRNDWAPICDTMYVCKGGTIDKSENILKYLTDQINGQNKIPVPKYFFVAILAKQGTTYKAVGFWMEHASSYSSQLPLSSYAMSIDDLESRTGIDFFCNLPDNVEDVVEKTYSASDWKGNLQ